ncbi:hypothetical protein TBR22_A17580 [Luteitalea sp. TBR-22]|uniref:RidA family protein n=1 Tax=Luteitalea sp. TBR-22 TaxID=2802971 RepID=UPI001AFC6D1E|nr:Rid family hydrolase [Luteitalea sp. TBR-22]BCS32544.1 hypothetical protein TBR22_A17580 [Luteitalea sp. TBR-22]
MRQSAPSFNAAATLLAVVAVLFATHARSPVAAQGPAPARGSTDAAGIGRQAIGGVAGRGWSSAVVVGQGQLVHTATFTPVDGQGRVVSADPAAQASRVLDDLDVALKAAGSGLAHLARLHVYVADASVTPAIDAVLARRFAGAGAPALTLVESQMPRDGVRVVMDAIAVTARRAPDGRPERLVVPTLPTPVGNAAHLAVQPAGPFVIVSGRAAQGDFEAAVRGTMEQLRGDLAAVGLGLEHAVQVKAFLGDMTRVDDLRRLVAATFAGVAPPIVVTEWRRAGAPTEIELVATAPGATDPRERVAFVEPISARYSRVARIFAGRPIFVSGLSGRSADPATQVREIFADLTSLLATAGSDVRHIPKATYYVADPVADAEFNNVRPTLFDPNRPPAASKISVSGTGRAGKVTTVDFIAVTVGK